MSAVEFGDGGFGVTSGGFGGVTVAGFSRLAAHGFFDFFWNTGTPSRTDRLLHLPQRIVRATTF